MNGVQLALGENTLAAFLLAVSRVAGFELITQPFNSRSVPAQARIGFALALALPLLSAFEAKAPDLNSTDLMIQMVTQILMGLALGFFVLIALSTIKAVG